MVWLYPVLAITQIVILGVVVPVRTASSISGEKERQTFDIMILPPDLIHQKGEKGAQEKEQINAVGHNDRTDALLTEGGAENTDAGREKGRQQRNPHRRCIWRNFSDGSWRASRL